MTVTDAAGNQRTNSGSVTIDTQSPEFSQQNFTYVENQLVGAVVATLIASDNIQVSEFKFKHQDSSLHVNSEDGFFRVNAKGEISFTAAGVASEANDFSLGDNQEAYVVIALDQAGNSSEAVITLQESSGHQGVTLISSDDLVVTEGELANFSIDISNAAKGAVLTLDFVDLGATENVDYKRDVYRYSLDGGNTWQDVPVTDQISLGARGDHNVQLRLDIVADNEVEAAESFRLNMRVQNPGVAIPVEATAIVEIQNNSVIANDDGSATSEFLNAENSTTEEKNVSDTYGISESNSDVAGLEDGGYVVVWQGKDSAGYGVYSQKFAANGAAIDGAILLNTLQKGNQSEPNVADLGSGKYLATWVDASTNPTSIRGQIMDSDNQFKIGDEFVIADKQAIRYDPIVGLEDGGFIVTWTSNIAAADSSGFGVYGQRFNAAGERVGIKFLINQTTSGNQEDSDVALVNGNLVVSWTGTDAHGKGVFVRKFKLENDIETLTDNFEDGTSNGWSNGDVTDGGSAASQFLGQFGRGESTSKTYDFGAANAGKQVDISFDFYEIDTWDGEQFLVFINGAEVSDNRHYYWRTEADSSSLGNIDGTGSRADSKTEYTFKATLDADGRVTLGFGSTLNEALSNESFGIDNISLSTSSVSPIGDEQQVNNSTTHNQDEASITALSDEGYVVTWTSYHQDGSGDTVMLQKFASDGSKIGAETQINTIYKGNQNDSSVTELEAGGYVVTWTSYGQDGSYDGIVAQRFATDGSRRGAEVKVNDTTYHHQNQPSIDSLEDGGYVISWTGYNKENASYDIYTKRYTKDGNEYREVLAAEEKNVSDTYGISESNSDVAGLEDGGYVVVWQGKDSAGYGVYSQKFAANGAAIDGAILLNTLQKGNQSEPNVADLGSGKYLATWVDASTNPTSIRGQIMDSDNQFKIGDEFVIADKQAIRYDPIVGLEDGGFIVTWTSNIAAADSSGFGVYGQRFNAAGERVGIKFLINQTTSGNQEDSDVALVNGNLVVSWTGTDAHGKGVFVRKFKLENDIETLTDNFEDGTSNGWSNGDVTDGGSAASQFLGQFGRGESTSKTYDFGAANAGKQVDISFDFYEIDTWDGEQFLVFINGAEVSDNRHYYWRTEADSSSLGNIDGTGSRADSKTEYTFKVTLDADGRVTLGFGSTLNEALSNESFGIDNISLSTSSVSPIGDEQQVNNTTKHHQDEASITALSDEGYVVTWTSSSQDGSGDTVMLQKFANDGSKVGAETQINTIYKGNQNDSSVTELEAGGYVVTWTSYGQDGSYDGIVAQRFSTDGSRRGAEVKVNDTTYHHQNQPSIDSLEDGGYVISWTGYNKENASYDIYTKRYTKDGNEYREVLAAEEKNVSDTYGISESNSDVAGLEDGGYVVVWQGNDSAGYGVYSQKFAANGAAIDGAILLNTLQKGNQSEPNVADLGNGKYLATWVDASTNPTSIRGQIMDSDNQFKIGDEFVIADKQAIRYDPIVGLEDGGFIVTWTSNIAAADSSGFGVYGQRFNAAGERVGIKFLINQTTSGNQEDSDVALVNGNLVVSWTGTDAHGKGVFVRKFKLENDIETLTDNFEDGTSNGWSNGDVTDGGSAASQFLGQFGRGESTSKTYDFGAANAGKQVDISFDFYEIDTWDGEQFLVFINGSEVSDNRHYYWRTEANSSSLGNIDGTGSRADSKTEYTFKATLDADGRVTLGFGSTLNEALSNESFGIDNISLSTSSVSPIGDEQQVNNTTKHHQDEASITALSDEGYVVTWTSSSQDGSGDTVMLQKFANDGSKVGAETQINTIYKGNQNDSSVTELEAGGYVVTWTSYGQDGSYDGIVAQRFAGDGSRRGAEVKVNDTTYHHQNQPSIDSLEDGGYVISWTGYNKENASYDIYTKRYTKDGNEYTNVAEMSVEKNGDLRINIADLLKNDLDPESDNFNLISVQGANHGTVELVTLASGVKQVVFKAADDFIGKASFTYTIEDEHGAQDTATVYVDVINQRSTPLILDLNGDGVSTLGLDQQIMFDIDADGIKDRTGWVSSSDGLLVRDVNHDGVINDASELLGEYSVKKDGTRASDGFDALADLDTNGDGIFDQRDANYSELKIWKDLNSDGISQAHELYSLIDAGVDSINLDRVAVSEQSNGNWTGLRSSWNDLQQNSHVIDDVWFGYEKAEQQKLSLADLLEPDTQLINSSTANSKNADDQDTVAVYLSPNYDQAQSPIDGGINTVAEIAEKVEYAADSAALIQDLIEYQQIMID